MVFVDKEDDSPVELYIKDFRSGGGSASYKLKSGLNAIEPSVAGNGYIRYWRTDYANAPEVGVHVVFGHEIGFGISVRDIPMRIGNVFWSLPGGLPRTKISPMP